MSAVLNENVEYVDIEPMRLCRVIGAVKPAVVSVRCGDGSELTITDISIDVRPNGVHLLLDVPEAVEMEA
ncbi:hypothetical protein [Gemmiger formicilis]|uniref:hypothetical protein n=1 Tax=Gemmiger formicilis TaxID=745368 RepID=UPI003CCA80AC